MTTDTKPTGLPAYRAAAPIPEYLPKGSDPRGYSVVHNGKLTQAGARYLKTQGIGCGWCGEPIEAGANAARVGAVICHSVSYYSRGRSGTPHPDDHYALLRRQWHEAVADRLAALPVTRERWQAAIDRIAYEARLAVGNVSYEAMGQGITADPGSADRSWRQADDLAAVAAILRLWGAREWGEG